LRLLAILFPAFRFIPDNKNYGWTPCFSKSGDITSNLPVGRQVGAKE
jgi:hypothetical protein